MEINEENFKTLAQYLQQTLSPDQNIRRPGIFNQQDFYTNLIKKFDLFDI